MQRVIGKRNRGRKSLLFSLCIVCLASVVGCSSQSSKFVPLDIESPQTRITRLDGSYVGLQEYAGKRIAILFWAKWCSKSRRALKQFVSLSTEAPRDTAFVAISLDPLKYEKALREYLAVHPHGRVDFAFSGNGADDEAALAFQASKLPSMYLIDAKGLIVSKTISLEILEDSVAAGVPERWLPERQG